MQVLLLTILRSIAFTSVNLCDLVKLLFMLDYEKISLYYFIKAILLYGRQIQNVQFHMTKAGDIPYRIAEDAI